MRFQHYDKEGDPELQVLMETEFSHSRIYYFGKEGYPRFDVVVLWKEMGKRTEQKVQNQLRRIVHY